MFINPKTISNFSKPPLSHFFKRNFTIISSMGTPPSPTIIPPPPPFATKSSVPMLYYSLIVIGTVSIVLALYNLIVAKWCSDLTNQRSSQRSGQGTRVRSNRSNISFISSFKYKRDGLGKDDYECAVCLSVLEEGEEVRQLPKCKHYFHAPCIDMWLYSHMDCPVCRSAVEPTGVTNQLEHSREGLIGVNNVV